jgi:protein-L-isoaspartate(D-aspartate) O-methyltransferase
VRARQKAGIDRLIDGIEYEWRSARGLVGKDHIDPRVLEAMRSVPRERFVPAEMAAAAFDDGPLPIGYGQTISQPFMVAVMTDLLAIDAGSTVLEVGTGSGYQAAVLSCVAERVYSIEIVQPLATAARKLLRELGYLNVEVAEGDGYDGWPEHAPYDGIIVTAGAQEIPPPLIEQLKPGARLVIPVGEPYFGQDLLVVSKGQDGRTSTRRLFGVAFVPLTRRRAARGRIRE